MRECEKNSKCEIIPEEWLVLGRCKLLGYKVSDKNNMKDYHEVHDNQQHVKYMQDEVNHTKECMKIRI